MRILVCGVGGEGQEAESGRNSLTKAAQGLGETVAGKQMAQASRFEFQDRVSAQ